MRQCQACQGLVPPQLTDCPHCDALCVSPDAKKRHRFKRATQLVLGASITMTLTACYGAPPPNIQPCGDGDKDRVEQTDTDTPNPSATPCDPTPTDMPS